MISGLVQLCGPPNCGGDWLGRNELVWDERAAFREPATEKFGERLCADL